MEELLQVGWVWWGKSVGDHGYGELSVSKLCGKCSCWFMQVSGYLGWRVGCRNGAYPLFCSWINLLKILVPQVQVLRLVNKSPFHITRYFSVSCFYAVSCQNCLLYCFFKGGDSFSYHPPAFPELSLLIFKIPKVKPH